MATATSGVKKPAARPAAGAKVNPMLRGVKEITYHWEGKDKGGKTIRGEMRASGEAVVNAQLRRQGIRATKIKKQSLGRRGKITDKDITLFTRQLATMMKAGVPLLQAFDIVGKGHSNRAVSKLLSEIKTEVETGSSLATGLALFTAVNALGGTSPDIAWLACIDSACSSGGSHTGSLLGFSANDGWAGSILDASNFTLRIIIDIFHTGPQATSFNSNLLLASVQRLPEPGSLVLLVATLLGFVAAGRRRRR